MNHFVKGCLLNNDVTVGDAIIPNVETVQLINRGAGSQLR